jgi:hypothetical protein
MEKREWEKNVAVLKKTIQTALAIDEELKIELMRAKILREKVRAERQARERELIQDRSRHTIISFSKEIP